MFNIIANSNYVEMYLSQIFASKYDMNKIVKFFCSQKTAKIKSKSRCKITNLGYIDRNNIFIEQFFYIYGILNPRGNSMCINISL